MTSLPSLPKGFTARLVGVAFAPGYPENLGRLEMLAVRSFLHGQAPELIPAALVREPDNEHDANSIRVDVPALDSPVGHLPRTLAARLAPRLDAGEIWRAEVHEVLTNPAHPDRPGINVILEQVRPPSEGLLPERG